MSTALEPLNDSEFAEAAEPLLLDYAGKLKELTQQALEFLKRSQDTASGKSLTEYGRNLRDELVQRGFHMSSPAEELARQVSAVVEQGRVEGLEKVKLWLQLSEFEHYLQFMKQLIPKLSSLK